MRQNDSLFVRFPLRLFIDIDDGIMKKINIFDFYQMGAVLNDLRRIEVGKPTPLSFVRFGNAERFLGLVIGNEPSTVVPFQTCVPAAKQLQEIIRTIQNRVVLLPGSEINQPELDLALRCLADFETLYQRECADLATFFVSQKRLFATTDLIEHAEKAFPKNELMRIPQQAIDDIRRAGRCIAFELPTAAGFHAFRALETVVLDYLDRLGKKPTNPYDRNLGKYIGFLKENGADEKICTSLTLLKDSYRNPLFHPTDNLEVGEDIGVFNLSTTAISTLIKDMEKRGLFTP